MTYIKIIPPTSAGGINSSLGTKTILVDKDGKETPITGVRKITVNMEVNEVASAELECLSLELPIITALLKSVTVDNKILDVDYIIRCTAREMLRLCNRIMKEAEGITVEEFLQKRSACISEFSNKDIWQLWDEVSK